MTRPSQVTDKDIPLVFVQLTSLEYVESILWSEKVYEKVHNHGLATHFGPKTHDHVSKLRVGNLVTVTLMTCSSIMMFGSR